jgi:hypothetical protein
MGLGSATGLNQQKWSWNFAQKKGVTTAAANCWSLGVLGGDYPLVNVYTATENHHVLAGSIHYFDWAMFNSYVNVYQLEDPLSKNLAIFAMFNSHVQ